MSSNLSYTRMILRYDHVISLPEEWMTFQGLGYKPLPNSAIIKISSLISWWIPLLYAVTKLVRITGKLYKCTLHFTCECPWSVVSAWNTPFPVHLAYAHPLSFYCTTQRLHWPSSLSTPDNSSSLLICTMRWLQYLSYGFIYNVSVSLSLGSS